MKKYNEILECVPLFRGISEEERQQMLDCLRAQQQRFATGAVILLAGDPADRVGVLLEGRAQVIREEFSGSRTILTGLNPGDLFAEAFALRLWGTQTLRSPCWRWQRAWCCGWITGKFCGPVLRAAPSTTGWWKICLQWSRTKI